MNYLYPQQVDSGILSRPFIVFWPVCPRRLHTFIEISIEIGLAEKDALELVLLAFVHNHLLFATGHFATAMNLMSVFICFHI